MTPASKIRHFRLTAQASEENYNIVLEDLIKTMPEYIGRPTKARVLRYALELAAQAIRSSQLHQVGSGDE